jgi:UDP-glucose 4-epimerase
MKNKNILITGAAGMIGSTLIKNYISKDCSILALDDLSLGKKKFISPFLKKKNFFFKKINLSIKPSFNFIKKILRFSYFDEIWLLAANSDIKKGSKNFLVDFNKTFLTTYYTIESLKPYISKNTKIVFASSSAIFGDTKERITENSYINPVSNYGQMKALSEQYITYFSRLTKTKSYIFRFPNVVGNNLTHGVIFDFLKKAKSKSNTFQVLGNGNQQKPYSFDEEIVDCMIYIISNKKVKEIVNIYNIGNDDEGISVKNIVKIFKQKIKFNKKIKYQKTKFGWPGDVPYYRYSTKKLKKLGFKFKISSKNAIFKTLNYFI